MRRLTIICLTLVSAALLVPSAAGAAPAKQKADASVPAITRVTPMRVRVGALLTIRGRNFKSSPKRNTVIFQGPDGRSAFAKPRRASRTKLVVAVPPAVARLVAKTSGAPKATRFKLRVLAGKFSKFTPRRLSPVVAPANDGSGPGGGNGGVGCPGQDYDGDLLSNEREGQLKLDPCIADTDGDSVEDGYEFQSAVDLNHYPGTTPLPYPGKRPYPNPLDPGDGRPAQDGTTPGTDYDGDGLVLREEFFLWLAYFEDAAPRSARPAALGNLVYSDGLQRSRFVLAPSETLPRWSLDIPDRGVDGTEDGVLSDDERDADNDGLGNWDEAHGRMTEPWWPAQHDGKNEPKESKYPAIDFLDNEDTAPAYNAHVDPDMDGDGVLDGQDDNDHDGMTNQFEVRRPSDWLNDAWGAFPAVNPWAYTNPFNPCKPFNSERCHRHPPFGYYESDEVPFDRTRTAGRLPDRPPCDARRLSPRAPSSQGPFQPAWRPHPS